MTVPAIYTYMYMTVIPTICYVWSWYNVLFDSV